LTVADTLATSDIVRYYQCDQLGTPVELLDVDGRVLWASSYRVWGQPIPMLQTKVVQPLRFQGQYHDSETGLHYNLHPYYDPKVGRFTSPDPIGLAGGVNVYQYTINPISWVDPSGLTARQLARNLQQADRALLPGQTPHHIVQENCGKNIHVQMSRRLLELDGIDINDEANGARLWGTNPSQEKSAGHPGKNKSALKGNRHAGAHIHSDLNDKLIYQILRNAKAKGIDLRSTLRDIGERMEEGSWKRSFFCCCIK
jgi:RHS repeat-associated protein